MTLQKQPCGNTPFFSIIIASLNNVEALQRCISSINSQDFISYEVLISDGGSRDGTQSILNTKHVRNLNWWKSTSDHGIYCALNSALNEARGQWILILGSDDKLNNQSALSRAHLTITQHNIRANLVYGDLFIRSSKNIRLKKYPNFDVFCEQFSGAPFIHHQSAFVSREAVKKYGVFDTKYRIHADYDLMLRIIKDNPAVKIHDAFVEFDASGYSTRLKNIIISIKEVRSIRRNLGFPELNTRLFLIYCRQIFRTIHQILRSKTKTD